MSSISIWTRLGNWLRLSQSADDDEGAGEAERPKPTRTPDDLTVANEPASSSGLAGANRRHRRDEALKELREGYEQAAGHLATVRQQLEAGEARHQQLSQAVDHVAESVRELPSIADRQSQLLDSMGKRLDKQQEVLDTVGQAVQPLPETVRDQTASLGRLREELNAGLETQRDLADAVRSVQQAVGELQETVHQAAGRVEALNRRVDARLERILTVMETQGKKTGQLLWAALGLAGIAAVGALIAILMHYRTGA
jgi:uncharacterized protein YoxC